ncbi:MAG: IS66 family transposase [Terrimonas sp.]|nr:IS66 family transposase [Terrimonas sp.]
MFAGNAHIETTLTHTDYKLLCEQKDQLITNLQLQVQSLQLQLTELKKMIFGSKGEKFISPTGNESAVQTDMFPEDKLGEHTVIKTTLIQSFEKKQTALAVKHPGRNPLPDSLRREVITLQPDEDVSNLNPVGKEVTERLEYQPGELFVKQFVRPEYIKPSADRLNAKRVIAPLPAMPLEKSIAGASLLTHLLVSKFVDHQPVYRQLEIFKRQNVSINHSTVSGWIKDAMVLVEPVYNLHCKEVLNTNYLNADETTIKVLDKDKKGTTHKGFYWVYYDTQRKLALFDYQPGRGALYPKAMLHNFKGYLQSDGYDAYEAFDRIEGVTTLCCWAHARRKFFEAKTYDNPNAELILAQIQHLYQIESHQREQNFTPEQIKNHRQQHSIPILNTLEQLLKDLLVKTLPDSPLGKAIRYTLRRWQKLCIYTANGILQIDNNLVENSIRPVALGRKNYLFAGSHERAQDAAMLYSLFATCRLHNVNPEQWLTHLLEDINSTPKDNLHLLLPQNYTAQANQQ